MRSDFFSLDNCRGLGNDDIKDQDVFVCSVVRAPFVLFRANFD